MSEYIKQTWVDGETPVDAEHMNHLEEGVAAAHKAIAELPEIPEIPKIPVVDDTLSVPGAAADAAAVGKKVTALTEEIADLKGGGAGVTKTGVVIAMDAESGAKINVSADESGVVTLCHHGKNYFPNSNADASYGVTGTANDDGTYHLEGTATKEAFLDFASQESPVYIPAGTYIVSTNVPDTVKVRMRYASDSSKVFVNLSSTAKTKVVTMEEGAYIYGCYTVIAGDSVNADVWVQVEMGNNVANATLFERCTRTEVTENLPATVYALNGRNIIYTTGGHELTASSGGGLVQVDNTLSKEGYAADAAATGLALTNLASTVSNGLSGKKWAVLGDSFTNGGYYGSGIDKSEYQFQSGKFIGKNIVYPYIIAERNNMEIARFFEGGRTLANPSDGSFTNSITNPESGAYYQDIPEDADYITIYLGINDSHHESGTSGTYGEDVTGVIPLGTIDGADTSTFCGAWNVVLPWLMANRPNAHIGIIVSNGVDRVEYRTATIAAAKKWGIPYLDLNGDERCPAMIRTVNPDISTDAKNILKQKWRVSETNSHPNTAAQYFQSTFIENWLRTL